MPTGPALIVIGIMMMGAVRGIDFEDLTEAAPAFVTMAMIVFTYNIGNGLTAGLILYRGPQAPLRRWRELHPGCHRSAVCSRPCTMCSVSRTEGSRGRGRARRPDRVARF